jgi:hypothetical protein
MLARGIFLFAVIMPPALGSAQTSSSPLVLERKIRSARSADGSIISASI